MANCPKCGHEQTCPCPACQEHTPSEKPWIVIEDSIRCSNCGLTKFMDWWEEQSYKQYLESKDE